ncbi:hypothetical protein RDWZM_001760 [Blomia tropicalis]|uniref:G-protein coupled receptors family 1 profile domain-containing protein n=1 Tax=Blomia tropicalis TaxID=40697 RepID=A0A9Q0MC68_BLOTA|nr:hypothetical protein RDWZM_001760 [Blomia tropicalis]
MEMVETQTNLTNKSTTETESITIPPTYRSEWYSIIVVQLTLGLMLNTTILCSVLIHIRQVRDSSAMLQRVHYHHRTAYRHTPVIDLILILLCLIAIIRLLSRTAIQLLWIHGNYVHSDTVCYLQGFINTFLHYMYLWTIALFVQDRYIAHYKQHDYLSKCSHFVLYVTLISVAFLTSMHICAPIYGFSGYRFLSDELTCSIDWLSRYSCSYYTYSILFVSGPAYIPVVYWTIRLTYRLMSGLLIKCYRTDLETGNQTSAADILRYDGATTNNPITNASNSSSIKNDNNNETRTWLATIATKPSHLFMPCCRNKKFNQCSTKSSRTQSQTETMEHNCYEMQATFTTATTTNVNQLATKPKQKCRFKNIINKTSKYGGSGGQRSSSSTSSNDKIREVSDPILGTSSISSTYRFSSSISHLTKSYVLTRSTELRSVTISAWLFILSYTPKMVQNGIKACLEPAHLTSEQLELFESEFNGSHIPTPPPSPPPQTEVQIVQSFYVTYLDETTVTILIPFILLLFHSKLRFTLLLLLATILSVCRGPFRQTAKFRNIINDDEPKTTEKSNRTPTKTTNTVKKDKNIKRIPFKPVPLTACHNYNRNIPKINNNKKNMSPIKVPNSEPNQQKTEAATATAAEKNQIYSQPLIIYWNEQARGPVPVSSTSHNAQTMCRHGNCSIHTPINQVNFMQSSLYFLVDHNPNLELMSEQSPMFNGQTMNQYHHHHRNKPKTN